MLDKLNETDVEKVAKPEVVKPAEAAMDKAVAAERVEAVAVEKPKNVEAPEVSKTVEAAPAKEESGKAGFHAALDGVAVEFELQYRDRETDMEDIAKRVAQDYARRGNDASAIELIQVYLKPTDHTAYYVINNAYEGKIPLFC